MLSSEWLDYWDWVSWEHICVGGCQTVRLHGVFLSHAMTPYTQMPIQTGILPFLARNVVCQSGCGNHIRKNGSHGNLAVRSLNLTSAASMVYDGSVAWSLLKHLIHKFFFQIPDAVPASPSFMDDCEKALAWNSDDLGCGWWGRRRGKELLTTNIGVL